jgi:hypothetical protein
MAAKRGNSGNLERRLLTPMQRFLSFCRFEPETACVIWTGGQTSGRGHHSPYGSFWFEKRRWFAHRWAAKYIHGQTIEGLQVDHCCPHIPRPNTLCVEHVQSITLLENVALQHRRTAIHLQVGLLRYEDVYGPEPDPGEMDRVPFYSPPSWLGHNGGPTHDDCPF